MSYWSKLVSLDIWLHAVMWPFTKNVFATSARELYELTMVLHLHFLFHVLSRICILKEMSCPVSQPICSAGCHICFGWMWEITSWHVFLLISVSTGTQNQLAHQFRLSTDWRMCLFYCHLHLNNHHCFPISSDAWKRCCWRETLLQNFQ